MTSLTGLFKCTALTKSLGLPHTRELGDGHIHVALTDLYNLYVAIVESLSFLFVQTPDVYRVNKETLVN